MGGLLGGGGGGGGRGKGYVAPSKIIGGGGAGLPLPMPMHPSFRFIILGTKMPSLETSKSIMTVNPMLFHDFRSTAKRGLTLVHIRI